MKFSELFLLLVGCFFVASFVCACGRKNAPAARDTNVRKSERPQTSFAHKTDAVQDATGKQKPTANFRIHSYHSSFSLIPAGFSQKGHILYKRNRLLFSLIQGAYRDYTEFYRRQYLFLTIKNKPLLNVADWQTIENNIGYARFCNIILYLLRFEKYEQALVFAKSVQAGELPYLLDSFSTNLAIIVSELRKIVVALGQNVRESQPA